MTFENALIKAALRFADDQLKDDTLYHCNVIILKQRACRIRIKINDFISNIGHSEAATWKGLRISVENKLISSCECSYFSPTYCALVPIKTMSIYTCVVESD